MTSVLSLHIRCQTGNRLVPSAMVKCTRAAPDLDDRPMRANLSLRASTEATPCFGLVVDLETVQRGVGAGEPLSLGIAAAVAAGAFAFALWYRLRAARLRAS